MILKFKYSKLLPIIFIFFMPLIFFLYVQSTKAPIIDGAYPAVPTERTPYKQKIKIENPKKILSAGSKQNPNEISSEINNKTVSNAFSNSLDGKNIGLKPKLVAPPDQDVVDFEKEEPAKPRIIENIAEKPAEFNYQGVADLSGSGFSVRLRSSDDYNKDKKYNSAESATFKIKLKNPGDAGVRGITIKSHIDRDIFGYVHNIYGYNADISRSSYILWKNISLAAGEEKIFSYKAQIKMLKKPVTAKPLVEIFVGKNKKPVGSLSDEINIEP